LALVQVGAVIRVRDSLTGSKGIEHRIDRPAAGDDKLPDRRNAVETRIVDERLVVARRKHVPAPSRSVPGVDEQRILVEKTARSGCGRA